jgi:hypothetical protein
VSASGFRLRTILTIIAALAILMGLGAAIRRVLPPTGPTGSLLELNYRGEISVRTGQELDRNGSVVETYLTIPLEFIIALVVIVTAPIVLRGEYANRGKKWSGLRGCPSSSRRDAVPTARRVRSVFKCVVAAGRAAQAPMSRGERRPTRPTSPRGRAFLISTAGLVVSMVLCLIVERNAQPVLPPSHTIGLTILGLTIRSGQSHDIDGNPIETYEAIPLELIVIIIFFLMMIIILATTHIKRIGAKDDVPGAKGDGEKGNSVTWHQG